MIYNVPRVLIDLENFPPTGEYGLSLRLRGSDRDMVNSAAASIGMRQADFIRVAIVNTAREVMREIERQRVARELIDANNMLDKASSNPEGV